MRCERNTILNLLTNEMLAISRVKALQVSAAALAIVGFSFAFLEDAAKADQAAVLECIKGYTDIGISPDAALSECNKKSLSGCVQGLLGKKFEAVAIKRGTADGGVYSGYLIDLGNEQSRWMEGKQWKEQGCKAYTKGPYRRQSDKNSSFWNTERSYEWFRQGWCGRPKITLQQPYSVEEAKLRCELGVTELPTGVEAPAFMQPFESE